MIVYNKKFLASVLLVLSSFVGMAFQDPPPPPVPMSGPPPPGMPINDKEIVLFVIAIVYGIYKIIKLSKKSTRT